MVFSGAYFYGRYLFSEEVKKIPEIIPNDLPIVSKGGKEFFFYSISSRALYGGMGNTGPI